MNKIYNFYPIGNTVTVVSDSGRARYDCLGFGGNRVCIQGSIVDPTEKKGIDESFHDSNKNIFGKCLARYFPLELFHGKHEGDLLTMKFNARPKIDMFGDKDFVSDTFNVEITVKLTGVSDEGKFEDLLYRASHSFGGVYSPMNDTELSQFVQQAMMISAHILYAFSIGKKVLAPHTFRYAETLINSCKVEGKKCTAISYYDRMQA